MKTDSTVTGNANEWQTFATLDGQPFNPDGSAQPTAPYNPISTFQFDANGIPLNTNGALNTGNTFNPVTLTGANISGLLSNGASFPNNVTIIGVTKLVHLQKYQHSMQGLLKIKY